MISAAVSPKESFGQASALETKGDKRGAYHSKRFS